MRALEISRLNELFRLDSETGKLFNKITRGRNGLAKADTEAGTPHNQGYREVNIDGVRFLVHHVVFAMANAKWPENEIDHINRVKDDNRPNNLREATRVQNLHNTWAKNRNTSGHKGVSWCKRDKKWLVQISINGKQKNLGRYADIDVAILVATEAQQKHHGAYALNRG